MLKKSKQRARRTAREKTRARQTVWRQARQIALLVCVIGLVLIALFVPLVHKKQKDEAALEVQRETQEENKKKQAAEQAAKEEAEKKRPVRVTITATGDCTFAPTQTHGYAGSFHQYYDDYGETYFFDGVKDIVQKDDFTLVNLECALTNASNWAEKEFVLVGKPTYANILSAGSVEGCSLANNHTLDSGANGLADTKEAVKAAGVTYAYYDEVGTYTTREGITIGYVSSSLLSEGADREKYLEDGIRSLREEGVDLVIACCHWGVERTYYPTAYQQKMAHQCIDWGQI